MDKLQWDLTQLCKRNRDGSFSTRAARGRILDLAARELAALGYVDMRAQSLKPKHVEALVRSWATGARRLRRFIWDGSDHPDYR